MQRRHLVDDKLVFIIARGRVSFTGDRPYCLANSVKRSQIIDNRTRVIFVEILVSEDNRYDKKLSGSC